MNREQAKSKIRMSVTVNKDYIKSLEKADEVINQIYDELEALLQPKTCDGCELHNTITTVCSNCLRYARSDKDYFRSKEQ